MVSAPVVSVYPAVEGPRRPASGKTDPFKYDFSNGFDPAPLAEQLSQHTPVPIPYRAPINWARWGSFAFFSLLFVLSIRFLLPILTGRLIWIAITIVPSLVFISGFMFMQIRGGPWEMPNGQWMASGYSNQLGKEVQVISVICTSLSFFSNKYLLISKMVAWLLASWL
jgi:oligosaccharyltransferase complex subunit gamma